MVRTFVTIFLHEDVKPQLCVAKTLLKKKSELKETSDSGLFYVHLNPDNSSPR